MIQHRTQSMFSPETILFDLDGTLIDTYRLYLESYRRALEPHLGYAPTDEEFAARPLSSERGFLANWLGTENAAACHREMCKHYAELHSGLCDGMYEGVREMLSAIRSAGIAIAVVTGKGRQAWEVTAAAIELGDFDVVITDDEMEAPKPHPGGLLAAAAALGVEPAHAVYVGDSPGDLEAGRIAGMLVGAALWPKTSETDRGLFLDQIRRYRPDWTFDRPADVTRILAPWC